MTRNRILALMLSLLMMTQLFPALSLAEAAAPASETTAEQPAPEATEEETTEETAQASPAPAYDNPFLKMDIMDMNEQPFDVSQLAGKPLMLNFWASWCTPCVMEMPDLNELSEEYKDKMLIVGIMSSAANFTQDGGVALDQKEIEAARALYESKGITYPSLIPNDLMLAIMYQVPIQSIPTTLFIDENGYLIHSVIGARDKANWASLMDQVLAVISENPSPAKTPEKPGE
ncbi:MAG: TlpA family protein disulfide reductase [Clostridiales bacterium]|nr:TlpA family protein disulfide reductase [Clostridiales bacterium]